MGRRKKTFQPQSGWALYLRTSSEEAQNPENSQRRQRHAIQRALLEPSDFDVFGEYIDNLSGRYASNRPSYQRMLEDARAGKFSHVAVENAERFGRNDTDALVAIDELHRLGVAVRFADYPDLNPIDPDDRILVSLSFTLARRESIKLGQRVRGGMHAKLRNGQFVGRPPDGYVNCEKKIDLHDKSKAARYRRWIEQDPEQAQVWREAWDLLLTEQYTLAQICEILHEKGYHFRSGRPFVKIGKTGRRLPAANGLSRIFYNWFYAGWIVSEKANIPPKTVLGRWKPLITTEEFEQGLAILASRQQKRASGGLVHDYLLRRLVYVEQEDGGVAKLSCSTPNASRANGGTSYYCVPSSNINIRCQVVDEQIPIMLSCVGVDATLLPIVRASYTAELATKLGHNHVSYQEELEGHLQVVDQEEARALRLYTSGKITDVVWDQMWAEWQDRRRKLRSTLDAIQAKTDCHINNLDAALALIAKVGVLYEKLDRENQKKLLREMVERVIVTPTGTIKRLELLPPFAYLSDLIEQAKRGSGELKDEHGTIAAECSNFLPSGVSGTHSQVGCNVETIRATPTLESMSVQAQQWHPMPVARCAQRTQGDSGHGRWQPHVSNRCVVYCC